MRPERNRASKRASYSDTPELQKARAAFLRQDYSQALRLFEKAVKKQPNNIMALTDAARAHGQRFEIEYAEKCVNRMLKLADGNPQIHFLAGQTQRMIYRKDAAIKNFQKAMKSGKAHEDANLELAVLLERRHQLDDAMEQVEQYLKRQKKNPEATLLKARILRRQGDADKAMNLYSELSSANGCPLITKGQTLNEWANLLDSIGDYEAAFTTLLESKKILSNLPETEKAKVQNLQEQAWAKSLNDSVTAEHLARWSEPENEYEHQSILLTGCPRSGTTLIEKILDAHPMMISADELSAFTDYILPDILKGKRDPNGFFDAQTLDDISFVRLEKEHNRYLKYLLGALNEPINGRILVDKNPSVTSLIPAYQRVWPKNRILYALRDPRDVAISCFFRWLPVNSVSVQYQTFEGTCKRTTEELEYWLQTREKLSPEKWHETRYEDTVKDYADESRKVLEWMGLEWKDEMKNYRDHMDKRGVNSPTYEAVNKPIYTGAIGRWKNYLPLIESHLPHLDRVVERLGY